MKHDRVMNKGEKMASDELIKLIDKAIGGSIEAAEKLGEGYLKGKFGGKPNYEKALKWSSYAARKGSKKAEEIIAKINSKKA